MLYPEKKKVDEMKQSDVTEEQVAFA